MNFSYARNLLLTNGVATWLLAIGFIVAVVLFFFFLIWQLWTFVVPAIWPTGPAELVNPGYLLFICEWVLLGLVGRRLFGGKGKNNG